MPLLDLKTDLKSLKYGNDQPGGGSSGQPYVTTDINTVDTGFNRFRMTKFDDGLVRGGIVGATNASIVDTIRIGKFLKDFPKGPLFIAKQVGLQLSNPRLETKQLKTDNPTSGGGLLRNAGNFILNTANKIQNAVGPTRIYNLGINTLAQVPVNAFGQHIVRHGFTPKRNDDNLYFKVAQYNNNEDNNRLTQLRSILGNTNDIANYISGPSSVYGIGNTIIRRRGDFLIVNQDITENEWAVKEAKEAGISYRLIGHEGGTRDGYTDASRRITNFTGVSDKSGSLFAPNPIFYRDGKSIQSVFNGRRDNTPLGLNDQIASANDITDSKYNALVQEASASDGMRIPDRFVGVSTRTSSSFAPNIFPNLTSNTNKPQTLDDKTIKTYKSSSFGYDGNSLVLQKDLGVSNQYFSGSNIDIIQPGATYGRTNAPKTKIQTNNNDTGSIRRASIIDPGITPISRNASYQTYQKIIESKNLREKKYTDGFNDINTFGIYGNSLPDGIVKDLNNRILPDSNQSPVYYSSNSNKILVTLKSWKEINRETRIGNGIQDSINLTPIFSSTTSIDSTVTISGKDYTINDLVKFRIQALNGEDPTNSNYMVFRAYLTQFSDNTDPKWNPVQYVGRGEEFYIYNGFTRKIQIGFKVAALSVEEMEPMYQKLNYLMSNVMPDYNGVLMRGPMVKMTVGNWIDGQDGILTSVGYTIPNDSPWEVALNGVNSDKLLVLPHVVEVSLGFTPIGSQTKGINKISEKRLNISHIAQNYNGYQYIK
jgi:hypothetical protein